MTVSGMSQPIGQRVLSGKRVAVVCGHFSPEIGYQEVDLATAFTRLGARVRVVTSTRPSKNARAVVRNEYPSGVTRRDGYEVVRLAPKLTLGANVLGCKVLPAIREFAPDHVVLVGPGKLFGLELFSSRTSPWQRIAIVQDNSEDGRSCGGVAGINWLRAVAHRLVKQPAYRRVVRNADRVVLNVPETSEIIRPWLRSRERELLSHKARELRLGFDPEKFYFDPGGRRAWRGQHGIREDELLLATCTRATPRKGLEVVIDVVSELRGHGVAVRYVLAGLLGDAYAKALHQRVEEQSDPYAFLLLPVVGQDKMREVLSGVDVGFWPQAAITIQQAMGTGLPMILYNRPNVSHLLSAENGWYVQSGENLEGAVALALAHLSALGEESRLESRIERARLNRAYLSYDAIALEMLNGL
jgi:glycosyltransferase involved in cell wall biosynthesis